MLDWLDGSLSELDESSVWVETQPVTGLPGWPRRALSVAPGQVAVVDAPNAPLQVLPVGKHQLGGWAAWYSGRQSRTVYALFPEQVTLWVTLPRLEAGRQFLLAGDDALVDASMAVVLQLLDPTACYAHLVRGHGRLTQLALESAVAQIAIPSLATIIRSYAAEDLQTAAVQETVRQELARILGAGLGAWGLGQPAISALQFRPALDLVTAAERSAELEKRLRELGGSQEMDRMVNSAEIQSFARQLEADYELPGFAALVQAETPLATPPAGAPAGAPPGQPAPTHNQWWAGLLDRFRRSQVAGELARGRAVASLPPLQPPAEDTAEPISLHLMTWLRYALTIILLGLVALDVLTMNPKDPEFGRTLLELMLKAGLLVLGILATLVGEEHHRRHIARMRQRTSLQLLVRSDLRRADELVRHQVSAELDRARAVLKEIRFKALRADAGSEAAGLKRLEEKLRRLGRITTQPEGAPPPYLAAEHLSPRLLTQMLSDDETLMRQAQRLSDAANGLLTDTIGGATIEPILPPFEIAIAQLEHQFYARQRIMPAEDEPTP